MTLPVAEMDRRSFRTSCLLLPRLRSLAGEELSGVGFGLFVVHDLLSNSAWARCPERRVNEVCAGHGK